jgi:serine/threonine-protein kinase
MIAARIMRATLPPIVIGSVIGDRFEILEKLGEGGMGTVYRAYQRSVQREVAIKLIKPSYARDPKVVQRFEKEARLASQLSQPNTVSVFDFGQTDDGQLFIAMELIRGRTLLQVLVADGVFSIERAVRVGSQMCDALEAAHRLGIIHRDLKHENVIVLDDPPGRDLIKILDFGLAKVAGEASSGDGKAKIVGTPRYLAPEAVITGRAEPASDIYALGVILAELTIGGPLWLEERIPELIEAKLAPEPALAKVAAPFRRTIAALIEPDPKRRPNASQARALLRGLADGSITFPPIPPRVEPTARPARWPLLVLAMIAIAGALVAMLLR